MQALEALMASKLKDTIKTMLENARELAASQEADSRNVKALILPFLALLASARHRSWCYCGLQPFQNEFADKLYIPSCVLCCRSAVPVVLAGTTTTWKGPFTAVCSLQGVAEILHLGDRQL